MKCKLHVYGNGSDELPKKCIDPNKLSKKDIIDRFIYASDAMIYLLPANPNESVKRFRHLYKKYFVDLQDPEEEKGSLGEKYKHIPIIADSLADFYKPYGHNRENRPKKTTPKRRSPKQTRLTKL